MMNLTNHFLIAMPQLKDAFFADSVVLICEHTENGAMGVVLNKPSPVDMGVIFVSAGKKIPDRFHNQYVLLGGPLQPERGFVVHTPVGNWQHSLIVNDDMALTTSRDVIEAMSEENLVENALVTIGYSSWKAGQLEDEIAKNTWLVVPADNDIVFRLPLEERYQAAFDKLGIRREQLMGVMGHA